MSDSRPAPRFVILKLFLFLLTVCGFFTGVGFYFPQKLSAPPKPPDYKTMKSIDELVKYGHDLAFSPGMGCTACHGIGDPTKKRCPDWDGVGKRAQTRKDMGGKTPEENATLYLYETITEPSKFLVPDFQDIMKVPAMRDDRDHYAIIAFLESLGGTPEEALLEKVKSLPAPKAVRETPVWALSPEDHGKKIIEEYGGCMNCHAIGNDNDDKAADTGPSLTGVATRTHLGPDGKPAQNDFAYILDSIWEPNKVIATGCGWKAAGNHDGPCFPNIMPQTFHDMTQPTHITLSYARAITAYLWKLSGKKYSEEMMKAEVHLKPEPVRMALEPKTPVKWSPEAVGMLNKTVPFARVFIQSSVERYARQHGVRVVGPALFEEAREKNRPAFLKAMAGEDIDPQAQPEGVAQ